jgi:hypothetical protein
VPLWRELATMSYLWRMPHALDGRALARRCPGLTTTSLDSAIRESLVALGLGTGKGGPATATAPT